MTIRGAKNRSVKSTTMPWYYRRARLVVAMVVTVISSLLPRSDAGPPSEEQIEQATLRDDDRGLDPTQYPHLHNVLQHAHRIYSGGEPQGDEAFTELVRLGVQTVVSVDGAKPQVESARRHGLNYVHIPIGYDGIDRRAAESLVRLTREAKGPYYIHCHHGKHRGPTAAAIACIAEGIVGSQDALMILDRSGTSREYAGLWRDVESFRMPAADAVLPALVEVAEVSSLAAAMAQIDRAKDNLLLIQKQNWAPLDEHPDLVSKQEALLLREGFHEAGRHLSDDYDERFVQWLADAEKTARTLESALKARQHAQATAQFNQLRRSCTSCHAEYRD